MLLGTVVAACTLLAGSPAAGDCDDVSASPGLERVSSEGWGFDVRGTRYQPESTIGRKNAAGLTLKWSYGLANRAPRALPVVTEDTVFMPDAGLGLVALDRETGCRRWLLPVEGALGGVVFGRRDEGATLYLTKRLGGVVAVDARDGRVLWQRHAGDHAVPIYSGTPLPHGGRLFVPLSSLEVGLPLNPFYGCCTTSGGMAALDAATGEGLWHLRTIRQEPAVTHRRWLFIEHQGPSGAPVWSSPTLDPRRNLLFFGTGQNYSHPTTDTSDAIFAVEADTGDVRWVRQFTPNDAYNVACLGLGIHPNCPDPVGADVDFGAPPVLATLPDGREVLLAGQKSGAVHAMDPGDGTVWWSRTIGRGGALGGVHWGMAAHPDGVLVVPVSDLDTGFLTGKGAPDPGVHALDVATGDPRWSHRRASRCADRRCWGGVSAAVSINAELVFAGSLDGYLEALDIVTGELLWRFDTWRTFDAVNGLEAQGGAIDTHGPMLFDDLVIVASGYEGFAEAGGNALLVFGPSEEVLP